MFIAFLFVDDLAYSRGVGADRGVISVLLELIVVLPRRLTNEVSRGSHSEYPLDVPIDLMRDTGTNGFKNPIKRQQ